MVKSLLKRIVVVAVCLLHGGIGTAWQTAGPEDDSRRTGTPVVSGKIGGISMPFLIADTGGERCSVNIGGDLHQLAGYDTYQQRMTVFSGTRLVPFYRNVPVLLTGFPEKKVDLAQVNLEPFETLLDRRLDGIVGMPYLKEFVYEYSAANGCRLYGRLPEQTANAIVLPLRNAQLLPEIEVELPGLGKRWLILDTGSNGGLHLSKKHCAILQRMGYLVAARESESIDGHGKKVLSNASILRWIRIGDVELRNVSNQETPLESIGLSALRHFRMVLDFPGGQAFLYFVGEDKVCNATKNASGMAVNVKSNGRLGVLLLREDSPATELGIRVGDEISQIDGLDPKALGYWEVQDILGQAGKTIPLTVVRDGKSMEIQMPLRHSFPFPPEWPPEKPEFNPEP